MHSFLVAAVAAAVIFGLRALPFAICAKSGRGGESAWVRLAEKWLSPIVIAALIVYSFADLEWCTAAPYIAGAAVVAIQLATRSGLVAIFAGTALYMLIS